VRIARVKVEIVAFRDANDSTVTVQRFLRPPPRRSISAQRASRDKANRTSARGGNIWRRSSYRFIGTCHRHKRIKLIATLYDIIPELAGPNLPHTCQFQ